MMWLLLAPALVFGDQPVKPYLLASSHVLCWLLIKYCHRLLLYVRCILYGKRCVA